MKYREKSAQNLCESVFSIYLSIYGEKPTSSKVLHDREMIYESLFLIIQLNKRVHVILISIQAIDVRFCFISSANSVATNIR